MYQFTFWFVYVVYVLDSVGFFGEEIVVILTVWIGLGIPSWGVEQRFLFWCGDFATVWREGRRDLE